MDFAVGDDGLDGVGGEVVGGVVVLLWDHVGVSLEDHWCEVLVAWCGFGADYDVAAVADDLVSEGLSDAGDIVECGGFVATGAWDESELAEVLPEE